MCVCVDVFHVLFDCFMGCVVWVCVYVVGVVIVVVEYCLFHVSLW